MRNNRLGLWAVLGLGALMAVGQPAKALGVKAAAGQKHDGHLARQLGLTPEQAAQIKAIRQDGKQQAAAVKADKTLSRKDRRARLKAIHEATRQKVDAILTADQKAKMDARRARHKQPRRDRKQHA